jgi:hypothetical protein
MNEHEVRKIIDKRIAEDGAVEAIGCLGVLLVVGIIALVAWLSA